MMSRAYRLPLRCQSLLTGSPAARSFLSDEKGSTMVEFAMISVPLLGLIGAIFESGMVYFNSAQLQTVTELAISSSRRFAPTAVSAQHRWRLELCPPCSTAQK
jgi:Flp pilus assembly protein TadG